MAKTLKDLLLALLNATLILLAVCLFLGWKLTQSVENVQTNFKANLAEITPLKDQMQGVRGELEGIRSALVDIRQKDGALDLVTKAKLNQTMENLSGLEEKLAATQSRFSEIAENPEELINFSITTAAEAVTDQYMTIRGCEPAR